MQEGYELACRLETEGVMHERSRSFHSWRELLHWLRLHLPLPPRQALGCGRPGMVCAACGGRQDRAT